MFFTVNLQQDRSKYSNYISTTLLTHIDKTLKKWEKVIVYLNKRGAYSSLICTDCQYLYECPNCDVSLTVHDRPPVLECHLCNHKYNIPNKCHTCEGTNLKSVWVGTQQIEWVLREIYADKNIYRFDSDSMKNISSKKEAIGNLEKADIIIGTKMITTGFDFKNIGLIWVLLIEWELTLSSFDSEEKVYSNLKQLIGRGNRKDQKTEIILQTFIPKNPIIWNLTEANFKDFLNHTLEERRDFSYPPFCEMVSLEYRNTDEKKSLDFIKKLEENLKNIDTKNNYDYLASTSTFRKNNAHHAKLIIKWNDIRDLLAHIKSTILKESKLSVIFHS